jgi:hypothetical protein
MSRSFKGWLKKVWKGTTINDDIIQEQHCDWDSKGLVPVAFLLQLFLINYYAGVQFKLAVKFCNCSYQLLNMFGLAKYQSFRQHWDDYFRSTRLFSRNLSSTWVVLTFRCLRKPLGLEPNKTIALKRNWLPLKATGPLQDSRMRGPLKCVRCFGLKKCDDEIFASDWPLLDAWIGLFTNDVVRPLKLCFWPLKIRDVGLSVIV